MPYRRSGKEEGHGHSLPAGLALLCLFMALPVALAEYKPEAGYGPFDKQIKDNRLIVANVARQIELSPDLLLAVASAESRFEGRARSDKGAVGVMQLMPPTAREVAAEVGLEKWSLEDPFHSALIGGLYLKKMLARYRGDVNLALAAYNAGPTTVDEWLSHSPKRASGADVVKRRAFKETRGYVQEVFSKAGIGVVVSQQFDGCPASTNGVTNRYACVVGPDDTFCSIARRHSVSIRDLWQLNSRRLNAARDGVIVSPGQVVWLRSLPVVLSYIPDRRGMLRGSDVEIVVNKSRHYLELSVAGTVIRHFNMRSADDISVASAETADAKGLFGEYYICSRRAGAPYENTLQLSYPNENAAWNALLAETITVDEYDSIIDCLKRGETPPWSTSLGGEVSFCGKGPMNDPKTGRMELDVADIDELFALTPEGTRVSILEGD